MRNKTIFLMLMLLACFTGLSAMSDRLVGDKMYIDDHEFSAQTTGDAFHIHVGNNVWLVTHSVHRDTRGLFAYECNLSKAMTGHQMSYEKKWRCPYCFTYWPIGTPCQNKECPSRYK